MGKEKKEINTKEVAALNVFQKSYNVKCVYEFLVWTIVGQQSVSEPDSL